MRLVQIYSNRPREFQQVRFHEGLNVIQGEIRRPENRNRDTHNLGKTTLSRLIDFLLLLGKKSDFFLFAHPQRFQGFEFFLEVALRNGQFLTIRRAVDTGSRVSFLRHDTADEDWSSLAEDGWDHWELAFDRSKRMLDGYLDLAAIKPWNFRKAIGYSLRTQADYNEPFSLAKYGGKHSQWKPYLAHILGLDWQSVDENYKLQTKVDALEAEHARLALRLEKTSEDRDQLRGRVQIQRRSLKELEEQIDGYNFRLADAGINKTLVEETDNAIADLNEQKYRLDSDRQRITAAMGERVDFNLQKAAKIFAEAQVYFGEQVARDYDQVTSFNRAISQERDQYLAEELGEIDDELVAVSLQLAALNAQRTQALAILRDRDSFSKYRSLSKRLSDQRADLQLLEQLFEAFDEADALANQLRELKQEQEAAQASIRENLASEPAMYVSIRNHFDRIVHRMIGQHANLYSRVNKKGNLEFKAEIINDSGLATGASKGFSYGRILCIAFDLAIQAAYIKLPYPHFVYHDGFLQDLDPRKKLNLIDLARELADQGVQYIVTLIDSELPPGEDGKPLHFEDDEVALELHDDGDGGRLFTGPLW